MNIYVVWMVILFSLRFIQDNFLKTKKIWIVAVVILMSLMLLRSGFMRPDLGGYTNLYLGHISGYADVAEDQPFISIWNATLRFLFPISPFVFIFFSTLLYMIPFLIGVKLYSKDKIASLLCLIILPGTWMVAMITLRQALAQGLMLIGLLCFLQKTRYWKIITPIMAVLALICHSTSFLIIPLIVLAFILPINRKWMYILIIVSLFLADVVTMTIGDYFMFLFADVEELKRIVAYGSSSDFGDSFGHFRAHLATMLFCCVVFWLNRKNEKPTFFEKCLLFGGIMSNLLSGLDGHLTDRFCNFFFVLAAIGALPDHKKDKYHLFTLCLLAYMLKSYNAFYEYYNKMGAEGFMVYKFFWE